MYKRQYLAWPRLREERNAEAYARKIITHTAISWFRRKGWSNETVRAELPETGQAPADDDVARRAWLWQALLDLPPRQRAVLVLRYYDDLTEAQTAAAMGCAVGTVKSQASAGLRKLRDRLSEQGDHLGDDVELVPAELMEAIR